MQLLACLPACPPACLPALSAAAGPLASWREGSIKNIRAIRAAPRFGGDAICHLPSAILLLLFVAPPIALLSDRVQFSIRQQKPACESRSVLPRTAPLPPTSASALDPVAASRSVPLGPSPACRWRASLVAILVFCVGVDLCSRLKPLLRLVQAHGPLAQAAPISNEPSRFLQAPQRCSPVPNSRGPAPLAHHRPLNTRPSSLSSAPTFLGHCQPPPLYTPLQTPPLDKFRPIHALTVLINYPHGSRDPPACPSPPCFTRPQ